MKMLTYDIRLKSISHFEDELFGSMCPNGKYDIIDLLFVLFKSKIDVTAIF